MPFSDIFNFWNAVDTIKGAKTVPQLVEWIDANRIHHDPSPDLVDGKNFTAGACYFTLRLSGLHLADSRRFTKEVLPLFLCLAEFKARGQPRTVPFCLGPNTIRERLKEINPDAKDDDKPRPGWIELRDIEILPPKPASLANLQTFIGLYSMPSDDIARTLLNVMGSVSGALGGALAPSLAVAEKVYSGFNELLGLDRVKPEVETLHGNMLKNSGYLLVSSAPDNSPFKGKLFVSGGRLRKGQDTESDLVTDFDYCLLAVQRLETIIEANGTAPDTLGVQWDEVIEAFSGTDGAAREAFRKLQRTIYAADLIARDRDALLAGYLVEFDKAAKVFGKPKEADELFRSGTRTEAIGESSLAAVSDIPQVFAPLSNSEPIVLDELETNRMKSGAGAWARAVDLRNDFVAENRAAGSVAAAIMRASISEEEKIE